jgi:hypothetical protein
MEKGVGSAARAVEAVGEAAAVRRRMQVRPAFKRWLYRDIKCFAFWGAWTEKPTVERRATFTRMRVKAGGNSG